MWQTSVCRFNKRLRMSKICDIYDHLTVEDPYPFKTYSCLVSPSISYAVLYVASQIPFSFCQDTFSTLALVSGDNVEFLLIIAPIKESYRLAQAAFNVAREFEVPLKVCVMWQEKATDGVDSSETLLLPWKNFLDVIEVKSCPASPSWWELCQMTNRGAILVRPDEHIAWRTKSDIKKDPLLVLKNVFSAILGLDSGSS